MSAANQPAMVALVPLYEAELAIALDATQREDDEALHDFRVALRRLHVLLKQLAKPDGHRNKALRRLNMLIGVTTQRRDVQVMLAWLAVVWPQLSELERIGARQWQRTLERSKKRHPFNRKTVASSLRGLVGLLGKLSPKEDGSQLTLGMLVAQCLEKQVGRLILLMRGEEEGQLHLIRLKAKTVRYLLAPLCDELPDCACAQEELRGLQARLGDWHDAMLRRQSLRDRLHREVRASGNLNVGVPHLTDHSPALPGLIALAKLNNQALQHAFDLVQRKDLQDRGMHLAELLQQAISSVRATTSHD